MNSPAASADLAERFESRSETETRLSGYWLVLVRLLCLTLYVLSVGLFVASILALIARLHQPCTGTVAACSTAGLLTPDDLRGLHELGLSRDFYAIYNVVVISLSALGYWLVAALLFWRKSDDRLALLATVYLALFPLCSMMAWLTDCHRPGGCRPVVSTFSASSARSS